jgi:hypothetical protein
MKTSQSTSQTMQPLLDLLHDDLEQLDPSYIHDPLVSPLVFIQEARELLQELEPRADLTEPLRDLGITGETFGKAHQCAALCEEIEASWSAIVRKSRRSTWSEVEKRGQQMREELIAAARYHLRHDAMMLHELDLVQEGEGAADLILDLDTLARFIRGRRRCFRRDPHFDVDERADGARSMAHELRDHLGDIPRDPERDAMRKLRARAFSLLSFLVFEIRQAGLYRFWRDEERLQCFGKTHERDHAWHGGAVSDKF